MDIKLLDKYINLCKEFNTEPSWEGLKLFKKAFK